MGKDKLIEDNMKLVYYIINKYYPSFLHDEDVVQEGMVGLCKAASAWDESKSKFSTFASMCILNEIRYYFRGNMKHQGILSLDNRSGSSDGESISFIDMMVGDEDVVLDYVDFGLFYNTLTEDEKELIGLSLDHTEHEIADIIGMSQPTVSRKLRKIRLKWRKFIGND